MKHDNNRDQIDNITQQTRGLSPLFSTDLSATQTRGLSPLSQGGYWWFVTFVTHNSRISERMVTYGVKVGEPLIFTAEDQIFIATKIAEATKRYKIAIALFNVLPDHVHIVVRADTEKVLNEQIRKIKGFCSYQFQRARGWDRGEHVWAQKFNRKVIENETALYDILEYVWNNHLKHVDRWGDQLIYTWENGLPDKGLKPLVEVIRDGCVPLEEILS